MSDGGPAFREGVTLRDYFAAQAMQAFCQASLTFDKRFLPELDELLKMGTAYSYRVADAMLAEREKPPWRKSPPVE